MWLLATKWSAQKLFREVIGDRVDDCYEQTKCNVILSTLWSAGPG